MLELHLNKCMFEHQYKLVPHFRVGPIRNPWGYVISIAEIGESWFLKCETPKKKKHTLTFTNYEHLLDALNLINQDRRY